MSPADKVDSWFASTPARPTQSSVSRPNTRDTAMTSLADDQSQLSKHDVGGIFLDPPASGPGTRDLLLHSFLDDENQPPNTQMDASTLVPCSSTVNQCKPSTSRLDTGDPFFDSVPKGPSQISISRWNAGAPAFDSLSSARGQTHALPWNQTEIPFSPEKRIQEDARPRLTLRIPNTSTSSQNFRSAPQMATQSEISDPRADAPHTADSLVPAARPAIPSFQGPQRQATLGGDILNPAARPFHSNVSGPRPPARRTNHTLLQPTAPSHTNSRTWTSHLVVEKERWQRVEESLGRMNLLKSSVVPKTLNDWLAHQRGRAEAKKTREQRRLNAALASPRDVRLPPPSRPIKVGPAFGGRAFEHKNSCAVLVFPSVWARSYEPSAERRDPLWPCVEEMKEEGDERNTSGFRRFPGLPRVPGNDTVQYKLKPIQPFLSFDAVWELPTRESVEAANAKSSPEETEKMEGYLGRSLLDALDCITEDSF